MLELAIKGTKRYYGWMTFLLAIVGAGFLVYLWQLDFGLGITGLSRDASWGFYIANCGRRGCDGGGSLLSARLQSLWQSDDTG
jgi:Ni/Fe-hydrogenase subunit HybB-like protein